jgi:hypothetical protein
MKKIILALALSLSTAVIASENTSLFPRIYNYGTSVQIQVWNYTDRYVTCSGPLWISTQSGASYREYYFDSIMPGFTSYRIIRGRDFQDRMTYINHSIFCR